MKAIYSHPVFQNTFKVIITLFIVIIYFHKLLIM